MTTKHKNRQFKEISNYALELLKASKLKVIILSFLILITMLTGIIVAAKTHSSYTGLSGYGIVDIRTGTLTTTFFSRFFSMIFLLAIMFGCSFIPYLFPLACLFLAYRAYLLGLNICLMILSYGLSGIVISVIIVFPCQLLVLAALAIFYLLMCRTTKEYKMCKGFKVPKQRTKILISVIVVMLGICIIEALLLFLFSAKFILVI